MNILDLLDASSTAVYEAVDADANVVDSVTAAGMRSDALHMADALLAVADPGDRVFIPPLPGVDFERAFFGAVAAGMIAVPLPKMPKIRSKKLDRIEGVVDDCTPRVVIGDEQSQQLVSELFGLAVVPVTARATMDLAGAQAPVARDPMQPALLQYTSGSTGSPKGVEVSEFNLVTNQQGMSRRCAVRHGTDVVAWLPSFHDMGLCSMTIMPAVSGARLVRVATDDFIRRPLLWLEAMRGRGDVWSAAPDSSYRNCVRAKRLVKEFTTDLSGWRFAANAAEPVRESTMLEFEDTFGPYGFSRLAFQPGYGLAESTVCVSVNSPGTPRRSLRLDNVQLASGVVREVAAEQPGVDVPACGRPIEGSEVRILDPEAPVPAGEGRVGEICVSGPSNARGYWQNSDATRETFTTEFEGRRFLRTGDLGFLSDGEVVICGRKKDLLIHAGENFYAPDLEAAGLDGLTTDGTPVVACFQTSDGLVYFCYEAGRGVDEQEEARNCAGALARIATLYPGPTQVVAVARGQIPRTTSGKVQRRQAAAMMERSDFRLVTATKVPTMGRA